MEQDEDRTLARLKAFRQSCVEPLITRYRGRTVKLMGDGALVEFASVVDAVRCAVAIQQVCGGKEAKIPSSRRIRLRIGINLGDVIREADGDLYGDGVNVAARLEHLAEPGGVIISGTAYDHLQGKLDLPLEFIGERRVRSIERPVRIYRVRFGGTAARLRFKLRRPGRPAAALLLLLSLGAGAWWHGLQGPGQDTALPDRPAIAVLPFDDFSGGERQERLAGAFTEDLITELARTRSLLVIARNSVEAIKGNGTDVREVGRLLGVHYVLEGSLQVEPARIRINAQLIDAASGTHLWSERYDRPAGDLFRVRDEVLTRLVGTLTGYDGAIWTEWRERAQRRTPGSLTAWDYYLLAADPYRRHDRDGMLEAQRLVERAIVLDPGFARAWAFLAGIHEQDALNGWSGDRDRAWQKSDEAAQRAADLDPADAEVQLTLGNAHFRKGEVELGWQAWQRALELAPNNALVNRWVGGSIAQALGAERAHEGIRLVERSLNELDPLHPPFHYLTYAMPLYFAGRYADVVTALEKVPDPWLEVRVMLALSCAQAGFADQARQHAREVLRLDPGFNAEAWVDNDLYQPGGSAAALFIAGARKAGLPLCEKPGAAESFDPRNRLPGCDAERARIAASRS
ncbi:MAG TPA: adenylate/guanylate cyclase domain-containing protein [Geminicoccus sp.]|uniref:adenylate/guanylate cyclase domain-containing protein n=1 Tax=Geminicoccus sp. TaxID=2024832 RepID=UPI002BDCDD78|nr:adenylate/guanylate cyclase domain-containing protein [Geminicoccus sp.]HWL68015.1 adenylate/guanylate cyclase domain-containing protein [Geminicoccus sp.]